MKINDLVNKVEPFRFEYDGFVLEGEYFKYRTTTPSYAKEALAAIPKVPDGGTDEEKAAATKARGEALERVSAKSLTDTIKSWNAEDDDGNPVPISIEVFEQLPELFITAFLAFLTSLREGAEKKESTTSPSG